MKKLMVMTFCFLVVNNVYSNDQLPANTQLDSLKYLISRINSCSIYPWRDAQPYEEGCVKALVDGSIEMVKTLIPSSLQRIVIRDISRIKSCPVYTHSYYVKGLGQQQIHPFEEHCVNTAIRDALDDLNNLKQ